MITGAWCDSYKVEKFQGIHQASDAYMLALFTDAATLGAGTTVYDPTGEVPDDVGYSAGGVLLTGFLAGLSVHTAYLTFDSFVIDPATISADGFLVYNLTRALRALCAVRFVNAPVVSTNGPFTVPMPPGGLSALLRDT